MHHAWWQQTEPRAKGVLLTCSRAKRVGRGKHCAVMQFSLLMHGRATQVAPTAAGTPWLGFVVYPGHMRVKARKVRQGTRRQGEQYEAWRSGLISFAEFDASVQGWINPVQLADSRGLRQHVLAPFVLTPGAQPAHAGLGR